MGRGLIFALSLVIYPLITSVSNASAADVELSTSKFEFAGGGSGMWYEATNPADAEGPLADKFDAASIQYGVPVTGAIFLNNGLTIVTGPSQYEDQKDFLANSVQCENLADVVIRRLIVPSKISIVGYNFYNSVFCKTWSFGIIFDNQLNIVNGSGFYLQ